MNSQETGGTLIQLTSLGNHPRKENIHKFGILTLYSKGLDIGSREALACNNTALCFWKNTRLASNSRTRTYISGFKSPCGLPFDLHWKSGQ